MSEWAVAMERHLAELVRLNEQLLEASRARREAIAERNVARLETLLAEEQKLAMAVYEEERRRRLTMVRLGGQFGKKPEEMAGMKVTEVLRRLAPAGADRLAALASRLGELTRTIQRVNLEATLLTQRFLPYFEELLGILVDGTLGRPSYTPCGQAARAGRSNMNVVDVTG